MRGLAYIEDNGDEFPINNLVRCGQAAFEAEVKSPGGIVSKKKTATVPVASNTMFFPSALPKRK
ncbi:hypothetical protein GV819_02950 [Pseudomonas sp. Fl5BN2]|uniref:hypothetical protein n=1 Tax=unclassified Pseudomonas TaxID=196821 RepID=UPI0013776C1E|nr:MULTISPECIES: hypothetical protein [unclassified Pseudomonas]NBF01243.1 hypothetical protein [Pseudomonas sp. Fl5BN2]NBF13144.1 hypothetical protein [Pseudomonas sp. Fl4BN1]